MIIDLASIPIEAWLQQGIFALLFVWLFLDSRKESKDREDRLMSQINDQNKVQQRIVNTLERLENKINNLTGGNK